MPNMVLMVNSSQLRLNKEFRNREAMIGNDNKLRIHLNTEVKLNGYDNNYNYRKEYKCYNL